MKKLKVGMLALSVLAGGLTLASAASGPETFGEFELYMDWGNPTNDTGIAQALFYIPTYGPSTPVGTVPRIIASIPLRTDGSGKISGSGYLTIYYTPSNSLPASYFQVDITGNVTGKDGSNTKVKLSVKGTGYTDNDTVDTNGVPVHTGTNATANSIQFNFDGAPAVNTTSNCSQKYVVSGTLKGSVKGATPNGEKNFSITGNAVLGNGCNYGVEGDFFYLEASTIANTKKLQLWGDIYDVGGLFNGSGSVSTKADPATYKFNGKGIGDAKGASFSVSGNLSKSVTNILIIGTNEVPVILKTPGTATLKGKAAGQTVSGNAITVEAEN